MTDIPPTDIELGGERLTLADLAAVAAGARPVLAAGARERIARARAVVDHVVLAGTPAYGITTGVGSQKDFAVGEAALGAYNDRLIVAHATVSPGPSATRAQVRAALAAQLHLFAAGRSGVRQELVDALLARLQADDLPAARLGNSVGASDIVAMSQLSAPIVAGGGAGAGPNPVTGLAAKEALSLLNNNSLTLGRGALALVEARRLLRIWHVIAALSLEGFRGNTTAWSAQVDAMRGQPGQGQAGVALRAALAGSALLAPGAARLLQDPLSFRCVPQIHGAAESALAFAETAWETELQAVVDNPFIAWETDGFVSHGNMETTLLALTLDTLRLALAKLADAVGERVHKIQWPAFSGLPTGLAAEAGAVGGVQFLNLGHIAAACLAAIRHAATPTVLGFSGQVCDGVEDVAGSAPLAVEQTDRVLERAWVLASVEAVCATWAVARRGIDAAMLGAGARQLHDAIRPLLPIGHEGEAVFDLAPIVAVMQKQAHRVAVSIP